MQNQFVSHNSAENSAGRHWHRVLTWKAALARPRMETGKRTESITPCDIYHVEDSVASFYAFLFLLCDQLSWCHYINSSKKPVSEIFGFRFFRVFLWISFPWPLIKLLTILNFSHTLGRYVICDQLCASYYIHCVVGTSDTFSRCLWHQWSSLTYYVSLPGVYTVHWTIHCLKYRYFII
jgi:hypothetical protein